MRSEEYIRPEDNTAAHVRGRLLEDFPNIFLKEVGGVSQHSEAALELSQLNRDELLALEKQLKKASK